MFNIDEKSIADNRTLITIQDQKQKINPITKNGTINYAMDGHNLWLTTPKIRQAYIAKDPNINNYFDKLVLARNGVNIDGQYTFDDDIIFAKNVEIKKDLVIRGNFTVEGQSSVIDTPKLTIEDNVIELNRNEKAAGLTLGVSGTALNRGTKPFARYIYSEPNKAFVLDAEVNMESAVSDKWVLMAHTENSGSYIAGEVRVAKKISAPLASFVDLNVSNNSILNNLSVLGTSSFTGPADFLGSLTVYGQFTAKSNSLLEGTLTVNRTSLFKDSVTMNKTLTVDDVSTFKKLSTFQQGLVVSAIGANITGPLSVLGNTVLTGLLTVTENSQFNKDVNVTSALTAANLIATVKTKTLDAEITRDLSVARNSVFTGTVAINNNLTVTAAKTTLNSVTEITGDTQITAKDLRLTCAADGTKGDLTVDGDSYIKKTLIVDGTTNLKGDVTLDNNLIANTITARNNFCTLTGDGQGLNFWNSDLYKIYMSSTANATVGGSVAGSVSDYNMYFKMADATKGFVFKAGNTSVVQIEGTGKLRAIEHMFAKGSQVLRHADMGHAPANNTAINACMVDGKHSTDLVLRDGTQAMLGDLNMSSFKLRWLDNDTLSYDDNPITIGTQLYGGSFKFNSDGDDNNASISVGAVKSGSIGISGKDNTISGLSVLNATFGKVFSSTDEYLRINDDNSHSSGIYTGTSYVRSDVGFHIGQSGATLLANVTNFRYKGFDVITTAGHTGMLGNLNMKTSKLLFNAGVNTGTTGIAATDSGEIYGEHDLDTETSRLVIHIKDGMDDSIVLRTANSTEQKDSVVINHTKATFSDNPFFGANRILHMGDTGAGKLLDADMLDGKHYSDLVTQFVDVAGDTMSGKLTMNNSIDMTAANKLTFNTLDTSYIRAGGVGNNSLIMASTGSIYFYPLNDVAKQMTLQTDGNLSVRGSNVLRVADEGHGNGIDADTVDGQHLTDLDNRFVNTAGDTMTGELTAPVVNVNNAESKLRIVNANAKTYLQVGRSDTDTSGELALTGYLGGSLSRLAINIIDRADAQINGSKILTSFNYGHTKGIDSDTLDGQHGAYYATATHLHDERYTLRTEVDLKSKYQIQYNNSNNSLDFLYVG